MIDIDLKSYTVLYLKNAHEEIRLIRSLVNQKNTDFETLHRICHTLKGQSFFMGFNDVALRAFELEKYYKNLLDGIQSAPTVNVGVILDEIEKLLLTKNL